MHQHTVQEILSTNFLYFQHFSKIGVVGVIVQILVERALGHFNPQNGIRSQANGGKNIQGDARNVIPLIVHVTHFYYYKNI